MNAYENLKQAILTKKSVRFSYNNLIRECSPHTLGSSGDEKMMLGYQFGGRSSKGLPPGGEWRCFDVSKIINVEFMSAKWHTGMGHSRPQSCVKEIDVEVDY